MSQEVSTSEIKEKTSTGIVAALFDVDGVLIDSFDANLKFYQDLLTAAGCKPPTKEAYLHLFGKGRKEVISALAGGSQEQTDRIFQLGIDKISYPINLVKMQPEAEKIIKTLKEKYKLGIVTSRLRKNIDEIPELAKLEKYFQVIVSAEDSVRHKPHPEPLEIACRKLGINSTEAVYIGDQETDIVAGKAVGMKTIFYGENPVGNPSLHTNSLKELPNLIRQLKNYRI